MIENRNCVILLKLEEESENYEFFAGWSSGQSNQPFKGRVPSTEIETRTKKLMRIEANQKDYFCENNF